MTRALILGAGGFIGSHLAHRLKAHGYYVRGVDLKRPEWERPAVDEFLIGDLRRGNDTVRAFGDGFDEVYQLAADMGGLGYISYHFADVMRNNMLINLNVADAARMIGVGRLIFSSSACVYPTTIQTTEDVAGLRESDALPALPSEGGYGWEKLMSEFLYRYYRQDHGLETRIVRFHNVYGPQGTWRGGKEKAPAAMCRKVAEAKLTGRGEIDVWGDGLQTRSFLYIDDALDGLLAVMHSDYHDPLNVGSEEMVSINELAGIAAACAGVKVHINHVDGPVGVRGRNSDNSQVTAITGWRPRVTLREGMAATYQWIERQVAGEVVRP